MNEITAEERLRIVEELNRAANDSLGGESLQRALARITGAEDTSWRGVMRRVAELAYRPTTQVQVAPTADTIASPAATTAGPNPRAA